MFTKIAGILGWVGTALVFGAVAVRFLKPEMQSLYNALAIGGLACVLVYMLGQWREIAGLFSTRQARLGTLASASVLIVLGILIAINYMSSRHNKRWDLTASKQFSVSDQTKKVLQSLKAPVKITVFDRDDSFPRFRNRLTEYAYHSKQLSVEYVDIDKKPALAKQHQVQAYGTVVFDYQGRTERVTADGEQELTNGLIKVVEGQQKKVYFVQGHGEKDTVSAEREGYKEITAALASDNFTVDKVVLAQQGDVPADAAVVIVAGPKTDLFPQEVDALRKYLRRGGKALFLVDPPARDDKSGGAYPNLTALLNEWGIEVGNNVVVDVSGMGQLIGTDASVPVAATYGTHPITERFSVLTAFPLARSMAPKAGGTDGHTAQTFVETSPRSWAETDVAELTASGKVAMEEAKGDKRGPVSIAAAVSASAPDAPAPAPPKPGETAKPDTDKKPETRVAAVGDSDFAANYALGIQGNRDLFLNTVNWLAQQENLIAIRPKEPDDRRVTLTADQQLRIFWLSILVIPGLVIGSGVYAWSRRRRG